MDLNYHYTQLALEVLGVGDILPSPCGDGYEQHVYLTEGDFRRLQVEVSRWVNGVDADNFEKAGIEGRIAYLEAALQARCANALAAPHRGYAPETIAALRAFDEGQSEDVPEQLLSEGLAAQMPFQDYRMLVLTDLGREVLRRAAGGSGRARDQHGSKAKVMPSAAKNTTGKEEPLEPLPQPDYPVYDKRGEQAVKGVQAAVERVAELLQSAVSPSIGLKPNPNDQLPWGGPAWDDLEEQQRRVLRYMHGRDSARVEEFTDFVWEKDDVTTGMIHTAISRANTFLQTQGWRTTLEKVRGKQIIRWV